ncbi:hypothetical protein [Kordiimonas pumila]|uniref:Uncharacterized protein n=1 Tax=Kordiimonas pumila TaxID=2161677 RepID=A0ABV7D9E6_9PROT|nr:hypothetical protein [Kordiimonas pumila]
MKHPVKLIYEGPAYLIVLGVAFLSAVILLAVGVPVEELLTLFQGLVG